MNNWLTSWKKITKLEWICMSCVLAICLFLQFFIDLPNVKFSSIVLVIWCLYIGIFKSQEDIEKKTLCFFLSFVFLILAFPKCLSMDIISLLFSSGAVLMGTFLGIKKRDKTYVILIGASLLLMTRIAFPLIISKT